MPIFRSAQHPWTKHFFTDDLRLIPYNKHKQKVYQKFLDFTGLAEMQVRSAFRDGYDPYVHLADTGQLYGYTPPHGNYIELSLTFVEELETVLPPTPPGRVYAPTELESKLLLILESTALHELVHYYRRTRRDDAAANFASKRGRAYEEKLADAFEQEAYGVNPTVTNLRIAQYMPKTALVHDLPARLK